MSAPKDLGRKVRALAKRSIKLLEKDGWCQGNYTSLSGQHCIVGAIDVSSNNKLYVDAYQTRQTLIARLTSLVGRAGDLIVWNDMKSRRKKHVIKLLSKITEGK